MTWSPCRHLMWYQQSCSNIRDRDLKFSTTSASACDVLPSPRTVWIPSLTRLLEQQHSHPTQHWTAGVQGTLLDIVAKHATKLSVNGPQECDEANDNWLTVGPRYHRPPTLPTRTCRHGQTDHVIWLTIENV